MNYEAAQEPLSNENLINSIIVRNCIINNISGKQHGQAVLFNDLSLIKNPFFEVRFEKCIISNNHGFCKK